MGEDGWTFEPAPETIPDDVNHVQKLYELYTIADPKYSGRSTIPILWDKKQRTIVSNESSEIIRMLNSAFDDVGANGNDYYPKELRSEIDEWNALIYPNVNNGVYRAGFATTQEAYEEAAITLFATLDKIEDAPRDESLSVRIAAHRGRRAAIHHADPLRSRLSRAFQMQQAADRRLPESMGIPARPLSDARRRGHRAHRLH